MVEFFLPMIPPTVTGQEHKITVINGKPCVYAPPELKAARNKLTGALISRCPEMPLSGPLRLVVKWCFPMGKHQNGQYKDTRPDTDNLQKLLKDCMTDCGYWRDDAQVASEIIEKFWAKIPGIYIRVEEIS